MYNAGCTTEILRVPQLRGLIRTESRYGEEGIVGILMDHIDTECYDFTFRLASALPSRQDINYKKDGDGDGDDSYMHQLPIPDIEPSRREKWSTDIQTIAHQLHALGIVRGDAKTANILLDRDDRLWVVDFGGGGTPGWMDKKLMDTKEGDLQALERILEEIAGQRRVHRSDMQPPRDAAL
jgi:serine/threonine protein kinase